MIGKVELFVGRVERGEEVEDLVDDFVRPRVGLVDLVDADDGLEADLQRLADHEFGLRHRAFGRVHEHDRPIHHREDALHLAAEIGMARRVDDVDAHVLPDDRSRLGQYRDAALAFEVVRIHNPLGDPLVVAEGAGLLEEPVDQSRLTVVDVGDNGDVAELHHGKKLLKGAERGRRGLERRGMTGVRQNAIYASRTSRILRRNTRKREKREGLRAPAGRQRQARTFGSRSLFAQARC